MKQIAVAVLIVSVSGMGCRTASHADRGSLVGSGLGAATGAIIGHQNGRTAQGAVLGAAAGAITGGLIGDAQDAREERDAAIAQLHQAELQAMTNGDLIKMTQAGISPDLIVSTVRDRGGRFDLSPDQIIYLKQSGVSDPVIQAIQGMRAGDTTATHVLPTSSRSTAVLTASPNVIVVPPRIGVGVVVGPRPVPYRRVTHGPGRHHSRSRFHGGIWW
jgi:hypothetical protein